jgi:hypothetical protein
MSSSTEQQRTIVVPPMSSTTSESRRLSYTVSMVGEQAYIQETLRSFSESIILESRVVTIFFESFLGEATRLIGEYKKPLHFREDVSAEEWVKSLTYSENEVQQILNNILEDFGLDANDENIEWLKTNMRQLISFYETKYRVELTPENRLMLYNLIIRMVHDRLCIKNLIT